MYISKTSDAPGSQVLEVRGISKTYPPNVVALRRVSLCLAPGRVTVLLGPNGAGKTTLVNCMVGLVRPDEGEVTYGDQHILESPRLAGDLFGVVFEEVDNIYGYLSVKENVMYFGYLNELSGTAIKEFLARWLPAVGLQEKLDTPGFKLSRGMKQKVALLIALLKDPPILILDEPSLGLDVLARQQMMDVVRELASSRGKSILLTTHDMPLAQELGDEYYFIHRGTIRWSGDRETLRRQFGSEPLEAVFRDVIARHDTAVRQSP